MGESARPCWRAISHAPPSVRSHSTLSCAENIREAGEHVAEAGLVARGCFAENHAAGAAARAMADVPGFEDGYR